MRTRWDFNGILSSSSFVVVCVWNMIGGTSRIVLSSLLLFCDSSDRMLLGNICPICACCKGEMSRFTSMDICGCPESHIADKDVR